MGTLTKIFANEFTLTGIIMMALIVQYVWLKLRLDSGSSQLSNLEKQADRNEQSINTLESKIFKTLTDIQIQIAKMEGANDLANKLLEKIKK